VLYFEHGGLAAGILQLCCIAFLPDGKELGFLINTFVL